MPLETRLENYNEVRARIFCSDLKTNVSKRIQKVRHKFANVR